MNRSYIKGVLIIDLGIVCSIFLIIFYYQISSIFQLLYALLYALACTLLSLDAGTKVGIIGFLVVILTGWGVYRLERRHNKKRSFATLRVAIDDFTDAAKFGMVYFSYVADRNEIKIRNAYFDTTIYEAIVHSGLITYFPKNLVIAISKLYMRIKIHNEYNKYKSQYENPNPQQKQLQLFLTAINKEMEEMVERIDLELTKKWWQ